MLGVLFCFSNYGEVFVAQAEAAMRSGKTGSNDLSASGGIASPSFSTSAFQNPAGLVTTPNLNLNFQGGWDSSLSNGTYKGGLIYGNDNFGLTGGFRTSPASSSSSIYYGLGVSIPGIKTSLGVAGTSTLSPASGTNFNAGMIIHPSNGFHLGFTAFGLSSGVNELGGGLGIDINSNFSLIVDTTVDSRFQNFNAQPGILVTDQNVGLTISYGTGAGSTQLSNGFAAGGKVRFSNRVNWEIYYKQLATVFTSLSFQI